MKLDWLPFFASGEGILEMPVFGMLFIGGFLGYHLGRQRGHSLLVFGLSIFLLGLFALCGYGLLGIHGFVAVVSLPVMFVFGRISRSRDKNSNDDAA